MFRLPAKHNYAYRTRRWIPRPPAPRATARAAAVRVGFNTPPSLAAVVASPFSRFHAVIFVAAEVSHVWFHTCGRPHKKNYACVRSLFLLGSRFVALSLHVVTVCLDVLDMGGGARHINIVSYRLVLFYDVTCVPPCTPSAPTAAPRGWNPRKVASLPARHF